MHYVYLAVLPDDRVYIGYTTDLQRRIEEHRRQKDIRGIAYYEAFQSEEDARAREEQLKQYKSAWGHLKKRIQQSIESV